MKGKIFYTLGIMSGVIAIFLLAFGHKLFGDLTFSMSIIILILLAFIAAVVCPMLVGYGESLMLKERKCNGNKGTA